MILDQPEIRCKRGHLIPANAVVTKKRVRGEEFEEVSQTYLGGAKLEASRLICEECAREAGGTIQGPRKPMAKPDQLRKLGQQTVADILGPIPVLEIR